MQRAESQDIQTVTDLVFASGGAAVLFVIIGIIWWILSIILFFKIWGMTNDMRELKNSMQEWFDLEHPLITEESRSTKASSQTGQSSEKINREDVDTPYSS